MKQVDIYNEAIAIAQASLGNTNQVQFEADMANKAVALGLTPGEFNTFTTEARNVRSKLFQFKTQDDNAARNAPKVAAGGTPALPGQGAKVQTPIAIAQPVQTAEPYQPAPVKVQPNPTNAS